MVEKLETRSAPALAAIDAFVRGSSARQCASNQLVTAMQAILPDLAANKGALLVTNGGLGLFDPQFEEIGVKWNAMGVSVANSAKHKVVALLARKLKAQGIYVGEVVVTRTVSTVKDNNDPAVIEPRAVAATFWDIYQNRDSISVTV